MTFLLNSTSDGWRGHLVLRGSRLKVGVESSVDLSLEESVPETFKCVSVDFCTLVRVSSSFLESGWFPV